MCISSPVLNRIGGFKAFAKSLLVVGILNLIEWILFSVVLNKEVVFKIEVVRYWDFVEKQYHMHQNY